jgi:hypothetical protein
MNRQGMVEGYGHHWKVVYENSVLEVYRHKTKKGTWVELLYIKERDRWESVRCNVESEEPEWDLILPAENFEDAEKIAFDYLKQRNVVE